MSDKLSELMNTDAAKELRSKKDDIVRAASTEDGKAVMESLKKADVEGAIKRGDTAAVKTALQNIVKTEAGARFLKELGGIMGKK